MSFSELVAQAAVCLGKHAAYRSLHNYNGVCHQGLVVKLLFQSAQAFWVISLIHPFSLDTKMSLTKHFYPRVLYSMPRPCF